MYNPIVYFLHGFAGDPADWDGVIEKLSDYECLALSYPFVLPQDGVLVGYSMGGRIALESSLPKIIISANPTSVGQNKDQWVEKLKTGSLEKFFEEWYSQPLFDSLRLHHDFPNILKRRLQNNPQTLINQLQNHKLKDHPLNGYFMHGAYDATYKQLYADLGVQSLEVEAAGHACHLENPLEVAALIRRLLAKSIA